MFEQLAAEWGRTQPFEMRPLTPAILGTDAPSGIDLTRYSELQYARFSRAFERAATKEILKHDPADVVVLANDISEGPDFRTLAARGYRVFTIFHVDVVDYVSRLYFKGKIAPESTVRWYRRFRRAMPDMAALVWDKQEAVVEGSRGLIVPSPRMRDVLLRCYPNCTAEKIHVLPWGNWHAVDAPDEAAVGKLGEELRLPRNAQVVLTLSRISPEKGQDILLESLIEWEQRASLPTVPLYVIICGEAAFMQGRKHMEKLKALAGRLKYVRVLFPGHVTGERKRAFFGLADLYVFPSRHESYGLTLIEAMASGLPSVSLDTHGARSVVQADTGAIVQPHELAPAIIRLLADREGRRRMGAAAKAFAERERFADRAGELAAILIQ